MPAWLLASAARQAAARTPEYRDRGLDLLRAYALVGVVVGHLLMGLVEWTESGPIVGNLLTSSLALQSATWLLQVMPLFFIAGGAANTLSWRKARNRQSPYRLWLWQRIRRLVVPVLAYLLVLLPIALLAGRYADRNLTRALLMLSTQLLWFLGIYLIVTALTPVLLKLHDRLGWVGALGWLPVIGGFDFLAFGMGWSAAGLANFIAVWSMVAQLGMLYLDRQRSRFSPWLRLIGSISAALLLVAIAPYPLSLVGLPGDPISNMAPPTLVLACYSIAVAALVEVLQPWLQRLARQVAVWRLAVAINMSAMTIYLWHLPVIVTAQLLLHQIGYDQPVARNPAGVLVPAAGFWWHSLLLWPLCISVVAAAAQVLWLFEHVTLPGFAAPAQLRRNPAADALAFIASCTAGVGVMLISGGGLERFPGGVQVFSGIHWTSGWAVTIFLSGVLLQRISVGLGR